MLSTVQASFLMFPSMSASRLEEVSALGAAYMAALGSGAFEGLADLAALPGDQIVFKPSESAGRIQEDYETWHQMIHKHC